jgi:hypothetical protein
LISATTRPDPTKDLTARPDPVPNSVLNLICKVEIWRPQQACPVRMENADIRMGWCHACPSKEGRVVASMGEFLSMNISLR